jgi:hypothetical protein
MIIKNIAKYLDKTYVKNRLTYAIVENILLSGSSQDDNAVQKKLKQEELLAPKIKRWDVRSLPTGKATEHEDMPGLWIIPNVLNDLEVQHVSDLLKYITKGNKVQGEDNVPFRTEGKDQQFLEWYEYHSGRWMLPLQPYPKVQDHIAETMLSNLHSTNNTKPQSWPNLQLLLDSKNNNEEDKNTAANKYAEQIIKIQNTIQNLIPDVGTEPCLFIQMQRLQRGIRVGKHVDDLVKGGKIISTAVLQGENTIRVGHIEFKVVPGDVYALSRTARYDVQHEVLPFYEDRLSATIRFGIHGDEKKTF